MWECDVQRCEWASKVVAVCDSGSHNHRLAVSSTLILFDISILQVDITCLSFDLNGYDFVLQGLL